MVFRDNFTRDAPHERQDELDAPEVLILYAIGSVIVLLGGVAAGLWWFR